MRIDVVVVVFIVFVVFVGRVAFRVQVIDRS
jgi:hypothetical protein